MDSKSILQDWVVELPLVKQSVLLMAVRGPDMGGSHHFVRALMRWYRYCIMATINEEPLGLEGWIPEVNKSMGQFLEVQTEMPYHFQAHFLRAVELLMENHPEGVIREWWKTKYPLLLEAK